MEGFAAQGSRGPVDQRSDRHIVRRGAKAVRMGQIEKMAKELGDANLHDAPGANSNGACRVRHRDLAAEERYA
jgi:hypothetical protein